MTLRNTAGRVARRLLMPVGFGATVIVLALTERTDADRDAVLGGFSLVLLTGFTALELGLGRWGPRVGNLPRDLTLFVASLAVDGLGKVGVAAVALALAGSGPMAAVPLPIAIPLGLVLADGVAYAVHRGFHAHPLLWRMHALHHQPDELYVLMSTVNSPLMVLWVRALPLAALAIAGFDPTVIFTYAMLDAWFGLASHTGLETWNPWLSQVWVTPDVHRLHHSARREDSGNHGLLLTLWDRVFGTFVAPRPEGVERVGLQSADEVPPTWIAALLLRSRRDG